MKVFITGASGYLAGDLLYLVQQLHPEYEITALARSKQTADKIVAVYPRVKCVIGDNNSAEVITQAVLDADAIVHTALSADDESSATIISNALKQKTTETFYIHLSGTGLLTYQANDGEERSGKVYDDIEDLDAILSFPPEALHRKVDMIISDLAQAKPDLIKVAIVAPPGLHGVGRGPINTRGMVVPVLYDYMIKAGHAFITEPYCVGDNLHIYDLSRMFVLLLEDAETGGKRGDWGRDGYYFLETGRIYWKDIMDRLAQEGVSNGLIPTAELKVYDAAKIGEAIGPFAAMLATNSRSVASRARKTLGWEPQEKGVVDSVKEAVDIEVRRNK